jgi:hypothetical protein
VLLCVLGLGITVGMLVLEKFRGLGQRIKGSPRRSRCRVLIFMTTA